MRQFALDEAARIAGSPYAYIVAYRKDAERRDFVQTILAVSSAIRKEAPPGFCQQFPTDNESLRNYSFTDKTKIYFTSINTNKPFFTNDPNDPRRTRGCPFSPNKQPMKNYLTYPLSIGDEVFGAIAFSGRKQDYTTEFTEKLQPLIDCITNIEIQLLNISDMTTSEKKMEAHANFFARMSHEIRTPLNGLMGMLTLVEQTKLDSEQKDFIRSAQGAGLSLLSVIDDILLFSKANAGAVVLEYIPFELNEVVELTMELILQSTPPNDTVDISYIIETGVPSTIIGDPNRLRQILTNLLHNGSKFTQKGKVTLEVSLIKQDGRNVTLQFQVTDTGIGMSKQTVDQLFKPFQQADASISRKYDGTGLGLAIVKCLTDMFNGEVSVSTKLGRGSTFTVTADFEVADHCGRSEFDANATAAIEGKLLLVCSENAINSAYLKILFSEIAEAKVTVVQTRSASIKYVTTQNVIGTDPFDCVVIEHKPPVIDATELMRTLQQIDASMKFVIIASYEEKKRMLHHAPSSHPPVLSQPIRRLPLLQAVAQVIEGTASFPISEDDARRKRQLLSSHSLSSMESLTQQRRGKKKRKRKKKRKVAAAVKAETVEPEQNAASRRKSVDVLIVEDNRLNQRILERMLLNMGYTTSVANNGLESLEQLRDSDYRLILMDLHMPKLNGFEAATKIREQNVLTPIVAVTADVYPSTRNKCVDVGMNGFLPKPISRDGLIATLKLYAATGSLSSRQEKAVPPASSKKSRKAGKSDQSNRIFVLGVDHNALNRKLLDTVFRGMGWKFELASDGAEAVQLTQKHLAKLDIILLDTYLPEFSGVEVCRKVRAMGFKKLIVLTTSDYSSLVLVNGKESGADEVMKTPLPIGELGELLLQKFVAKTKREKKRKRKKRRRKKQSMARKRSNTSQEQYFEQLQMQVLTISGNDADVAKETWRIFLQTKTKYIRMIINGLKKHNYVEIGEAAHSLKSSAGAVGAVNMQQKLHNIQCLCEADKKNRDQIKRAVCELQGLSEEMPERLFPEQPAADLFS